MNYDLIKISFDENTGQEVAYLLDKQSGRLMKVFVEDMTRGARRMEPVRMPDRELAAPVYPPRSAFQEERPYVPPEHAGGFVPKAFKDAVPPPAPELPLKPPPLRPPPHLAGVMIEADSPGAAVETRRM